MINNKEKNFISAIVYIHNNEKEIRYFLKEINTKLSEHFDKYEIICVNDNSNDKSVEEIKNLSAEFPETVISIVNMSYYHGIELSMNAGLDAAIGDFVYEFDSCYIDYKLDTIIEVYNHSLNGYDIVSAVSNKNKHISSKIFYKLFNNNFKSSYHINTETFRILSRRVINRVKAINQTLPYRKAIYASCGLSVDTVKYEAVKSKKNYVSKEDKIYRKELAIDSLVLFTDVFYKFAIAMSVIMMLTTIATAIYTIYIFTSSKPIEGWTTTMLLLSFAFFGIFAILTVMIKYLSIIIDLVFKKQKYLVQSIEKIN